MEHAHGRPAVMPCISTPRRPLHQHEACLCCMQAASEFARTKTMAEQRRFLPVYDCREELLQVIRENQVVVVVGETGSGKTTQARMRMLTHSLCRSLCFQGVLHWPAAEVSLENRSGQVLCWSHSSFGQAWQLPNNAGGLVMHAPCFPVRHRRDSPFHPCRFQSGRFVDNSRGRIAEEL